MTSFDIAAATHEINKSIEGSYLSKIYQIGTQTLLFRLRTQNTSKVQLLMEAGKRIHITSYVHETPKKPSAFCMSLRKYLDNGIIKVVKQHEFERIVIIEVATRQGDFQLVLELFGGGNTILVNPEGKILQAMTYKRMRDRNILRNEPFQHAPARGKNPQKIAVEDFLEIKSLGETEIVRALTKFFSISGTYAEEILLRAHINKDIKCATVTEDELKLIFIVIKQLISVTSSAKLEPAIIVDSENVWVDVTPVSLVMYAKLSQKKFECFNSALDEYYTKKGDVERGDEATKDFESELARQQRILQRQEKALEALKEPIIKNKTVGDLIYLHFGDLQSLFNKVIEQKISGKSWEQIIANLEAGKKVSNRPDIFFSSLEPKNQVLHVIVENKTFSLNLRQSIQVNADHYYMRSKKA
jgi:predicted ribosome quality control (RQC) complex YloA/Tae2 family protein